jgi:hypothetical protein
MGCSCLQDKRAVLDPVAVKWQDKMGEEVEPHPAGRGQSSISFQAQAGTAAQRRGALQASSSTLPLLHLPAGLALAAVICSADSHQHAGRFYCCAHA